MQYRPSFLLGLAGVAHARKCVFIDPRSAPSRVFLFQSGIATGGELCAAHVQRLIHAM